MPNNKQVEPRLYDNLAEDALSILRIDFILAGLYLTAFGFLAQASGQEVVLSVLDATYTQLGFHALFASMAASVLIYRKARRISAQGVVVEKESYPENIQTINIVAAAAFASFGSVVCMTVGVIEAFAGRTPLYDFQY